MTTESWPPIMAYFQYNHLPEPLQATSKVFSDAAWTMLKYTKPGPEQSAGLRKLLEAKDCFVRAAL